MFLTLYRSVILYFRDYYEFRFNFNTVGIDGSHNNLDIICIFVLHVLLQSLALVCFPCFAPMDCFRILDYTTASTVYLTWTCSLLMTHTCFPCEFELSPINKLPSETFSASSISSWAQNPICF